MADSKVDMGLSTPFVSIRLSSGRCRKSTLSCPVLPVLAVTETKSVTESSPKICLEKQTEMMMEMEEKVEHLWQVQERLT
ncbi:hypothetical protein ACLKA6_008253 [Drosophila palustris]